MANTILDDAGKASKKEADYGAGGRDHCGICRYFLVIHPQLSVGGCSKVKGPIRPQDWCRYYEHGDSHATVRINRVPPKAASGARMQPAREQTDD